jgi:hypothetical protein
VAVDSDNREDHTMNAIPEHRPPRPRLFRPRLTLIRGDIYPGFTECWCASADYTGLCDVCADNERRRETFRVIDGGRAPEPDQ